MSAKQDWSHLRSEYAREGLTIARGVIDEDLVEEGRQHIEWLAKKNPDVRPEQLGHTLMTQDAFWVRLIGDDCLLDVAEQFIGPNIALFASHYIAKPPRDGQPRAVAPGWQLLAAGADGCRHALALVRSFRCRERLHAGDSANPAYGSEGDEEAHRCRQRAGIGHGRGAG